MSIFDLTRAQALDETILRAARGAPGWAVPIFHGLTVVGAGWGLLALVPFLARRTTRFAATWALGACVATSGLVSLLKLIVGRARPCDALAWCAPIAVASPGGGSFPSGHAAGSFAVAAFAAWQSPKLAAVMLPYAVGVAWSRCVLGVHYPSDVLAGALLGAAVGTAFALAHRARATTATGVETSRVETTRGARGRAVP